MQITRDQLDRETLEGPIRGGILKGIVAYGDDPATTATAACPPSSQPLDCLPEKTQSASTDTTLIRLVETKKSKRARTQQTFSQEQVDQLRRNPPPYTTLSEIAVVLQLSTRTIMRYVEDRRIPAMNRGKHALLFNTRRVLEALEKCF